LKESRTNGRFTRVRNGKPFCVSFITQMSNLSYDQIEISFTCQCNVNIGCNLFVHFIFVWLLIGSCQINICMIISFERFNQSSTYDLKEQNFFCLCFLWDIREKFGSMLVQLEVVTNQDVTLSNHCCLYVQVILVRSQTHSKL